jgi:transposase
MNLEERVPSDHPLRAIRRTCDAILVKMSRDFNAAYSAEGRPSIPPEQLLKALLLQALYSIRSETQLMQAIDFNLLYRWFLELPLDEAVWTPETFSMNRQRFEKHQFVRKFFDRIVTEAIEAGLVSSEHFTVDGTLIQSWASLKSLKPRDPKQAGATHEDDDPGNPTINFHGQKRGNATHVSTTDPEAMLARKGSGKEARLCHSGHVLMENRHGLCLAMTLDAADGRAERRCARKMLRWVKRRHRLHPRTVGFDKGYDDGTFLNELEADGTVPHVPVREGAIRAQDEAGDARRRARRRMKNKGYAISQRIRKRVEEIIGWCKTIGGMARTRFVKRWKITQELMMSGASYNLLRLARLIPTG